VPALYRLQWVDAEIRGGRFPNAKSLADRFEISRRQALRDFDYMRDSLGAPLEYSAQQRGFTYSEDSFVLPGPFVTESQRAALAGLGRFYEDVAKRDELGGGVYGQLAGLLHRLSGATRALGQVAAWSAAGEMPSLIPYRAVVSRPGGWRRAPTGLEPYWRGTNENGDAACEFHDADAFITALLGCGVPCRVEWPRWVRETLHRKLAEFVGINAGMTHLVTPTLVPSSQEPGAGPGHCDGRSAKMTRKETNARWRPLWMSYIGAVEGTLKAAGMCEWEYYQLMGISGLAWHMNMHDLGCVSSVTVYDWMYEHQEFMDRIGVLSEHFQAMPGEATYEAACRRAVTRLKESIDRGIGAVLWGVDTGEFGVVYGYDDADGVFLVDGCAGCGEDSSKPVLYENVGRTFPGAPFLYYQLFFEKVAVDRDKLFRSSLETYVRRLEQQAAHEPAYKRGLAGYDNWVKAIHRDDLDQRGMRYNTVVYAQAKLCGTKYLEFLADTWKGVPGLPAIAEAHGRVSDTYLQLLQVIDMPIEEPWKLEQPLPAEQARAMEPLIRQAKAQEEEVLALVKKALSAG